MPQDILDAAYVAELLRRQGTLQAEAQQVIAKLNLHSLLSQVGKPEQIGSSMAGLMVWRDLDFNILCPHPTPDLIFAAVQPLLVHPRVTKLHYHNDTGKYAPAELRGDERYYFVVYYENEAGNEWKIDLSFWLSDAPRTQLAYIEYLNQKMTEETKLAILWIKDVWCHHATYPYQVGGTDIYNAVLEHGVRTPEQFRSYLLEHGIPAE
ncbi:hypothetical protein KSF_052390 [Reticulibacter mediterranei]|uniref:Nucleotidyltransferase n=1 Tax=Reticulibacter mediterranei TaxID=2778369 RepID=A0A8J3IS07_9CHLR|nr:hypothetical protein [Reticulibacter mediterranei]GHO95191.1 hypothetical protein KSF_052390 [Reticulibacter mediterranei]